MKKTKTFLLLLIIFILLIRILYYFNIIPHPYYTSEDFKITELESDIDFNSNGIDDYHDIVSGARLDAQNKPKYHSAYYAGGYPPDNEGVCTDVFWRALKYAGYNIKDMIDEDIANHVELYPRVNGIPDPNIDFRRVPNLKVFLERHCEVLTLDLTQIEKWQPGDIVIFGENGGTHIGIISDKRNKDGVPFMIHNAGQPVREEDVLTNPKYQSILSGHYRWNLKEDV